MTKLTSSIKQEIKSNGADLAPGETTTIVCPFCRDAWEHQGRPATWRPNRSFSITRDTLGLLYKCFRASCPARGFIGTTYIDSKQAMSPRKSAPKEYPCETRLCNEKELEFLLSRFEITEDLVNSSGIRYCDARGSYVFPILDWRGYTIGVVDRDFSGKRDLKAISYFFTDGVRLHFTPVKGRACIVVEDIPSAIKASTMLPAVALMGTSLNDDQINLLARVYDTVYLALDEDATSKAVSLLRKYSLYFKKLEVLPLQKDIKDTSYNELKLILPL